MEKLIAFVLLCTGLVYSDLASSNLFYSLLLPTLVIACLLYLFWYKAFLALCGAYLSYLKPYQVTIGESVLDKYLFTGRFQGGGLAFGTTIGGGVDNVYLDIWTQFGLGAVLLTRNMTLNEVAPEDWLIGYVQGNVTLEYRWALWKKFGPTLILVPSATVSGASFFFFETDVQEGEDFVTPQVNWDVLWTVRLTLVLTL